VEKDGIFLIGFNYSRLNAKNAFTEGPGYEEGVKDYQHPKYLKLQERQTQDPEQALRRFRPGYEYYSTGIVLLEIALWNTLHKMTLDWKGAEPAQVTKAVIKHYIPVVKTYMGDSYASAVEKCLRIYSSGVSANDRGLDFEREVLQPIMQRKV
jgi:hypothetical protein